MLIFDLETDDLLPKLTKIHCVGIYDTADDSYTIYDPARENPSVKEAILRLQEADCICGHNIIGFDIKAIQKLIPGWKPKGDVLDTLVWARVANTTIREGDFARVKTGEITTKLIGSHSLKAYGLRMGILKGDYGEQENAWAEWSPEMSAYCLRDVEVTVTLWKRLQYREVPEKCLRLEHQVATIIDRQIDHGWLFDVPKAELLYAKLLARRTELLEEIREVCPPYTKKLPDFVPKRDNKKLGYKKGVPVPRTKTQDFNPGSSMHVADFFIRKYGWEPTEYTPNSGQPVINDEILAKLEYPEAKLIGEYLMVNKRISQLAEGKEAWLKRVEEDDRIHGFVNPNGAVTGRMTHSKPNVAQVPSNDAPYGEECRELFTVPKGRKLVGCDAAGLELRMLAHYMFPYDNGEYAQAVLHGRKEDGTDAHTMNAKALGMTRSEGKTWFYGFIYGAGNKLLGGGDPSKGQRLRAKFLRNLPALKRLINDVQQKIRDTMDKEKGIPGRLSGLDGRPLYSRSLHSALNLLLQAAGAVLMKQALVIADERLDLTRCEFVGNIHDEFQVESDEDYAETCGQILRQSIIDAGEHFKLNVPMDGEYAIGDSWKETH